VDRRPEAVLELFQGGVGLFTDQDDQAVAVLGIEFGVVGAASVQGGERAGQAAALEQAADPRGANAEPLGDLLAGAALLVAGADDPLAEIL
jgi:hypothetical protein